MTRRLPLVLFASLLAAAAWCQGVPAEPARKRVVLALSGGGAYGLMYLGALEWMERHRIPVDAIAGTSGGALVGGWYATGIEMLPDAEILDPHEPRRAADLRLGPVAPVLRDIDFEHLFDSGPDYRNLSMLQKRERRAYPNDLFSGFSGLRGLRRDGLVPGQTVGFFLDWIGRDYPQGFEGLPTPFRAVATDATSSDPARWRSVVLGGAGATVGLSRAMRASIAVPILFAPIVVDGRRLIDGAVLDNLPTDVAIDAFDPDVLIALRFDNGSGPDPYRSGRGGKEPLEKAVLTFDPRPYRVDQFARWRELAWIGYQGMEANRAQLERYALSPEAYLAYRKARRGPHFDHTIRRVEGDVGGLDGVRQAVLGKDLDSLPATRALGEALDRLVADQGLATAGYEIRPGGVLYVRVTRHRGETANARVGIEGDVNSADRPWGGLHGRVSDLHAERTDYWLDATVGTDPALAGGLDLPLVRGLSLDPTFRMDRQFEFAYRDGHRRSQVAIDTAEADLALAYRPTRATEFALGGFALANGAGDRNGEPLDTQTGSYHGLFARAEADTTDDPAVPRRGTRAWLEGRAYGGAFSRLEGSIETHGGPRRDAWGLNAGFGTAFGGDVPFPFRFRPDFDLYRRDELRNDAYGLVGISETHALAPLPFALGRLFAITRVENAWANGRTYPDASMSLLSDTRAGVFSVGLGVAEHGAVRFLLGAGRRF